MAITFKPHDVNNTALPPMMLTKGVDFSKADLRASGIEFVPNLPQEPPPLGEHLKMVGVRMNQAEVEAIDKARGKVSRQDFIRKAVLWLADQVEKLG